LATDIISPRDVPSFDRSTVDGYAVKATDTFGADEDQPIILKPRGHIAIGELPRVVVKNGTVAETVTGAPLPKGADAVVMLEYTIQRGNEISIHRPVSKGENVMKAGSDVQVGEKVLRKGQVLGPRETGVLAALGLPQVAVYERPKVAILSTGEEIVEQGKSLPPGKIYDINVHTFSAAVLECGGEPISLGVIPDDVDSLEVALAKALGSADVVVTSGGVSVGPKDIVPKVLDTLGEPGVIVNGIAVKPGKPTTVAIVNQKLIFSLPGHPTSSLLMFYLIVRPVLCRMSGRSEVVPLTLKAAAATRMFPARGRRTFVMVTLAFDKSGKLLASPVPLGLSGAITTLAKADGFVEIEEKRQFVDVGEEVTVHLFRPKKEF
jgi:putative molybdopterin biosynthesis protein